jgi:hypothetical protein
VDHEKLSPTACLELGVLFRHAPITVLSCPEFVCTKGALPALTAHKHVGTSVEGLIRGMKQHKGLNRPMYIGENLQCTQSDSAAYIRNIQPATGQIVEILFGYALLLKLHAP